MDMQLSAEELAQVASHLLAAKMFSLASCIMLFYDIIITFGEEVEKIWKQPFTGASVLWFLNRYLSPLGYIVIIASFHHPSWENEVCERYVLYPEVLKLFTTSIVGLIFILRLYSIYGGSMYVLGPIVALLFAQLGVKIWAFTDGTALELPEGLVGCILTGKDGSDRFVFTWVAELVFDTAVFVATLTRTLTIYRRNRTGAVVPLIKVMMRDGIIYFLIIFVANLVTVVLFLMLPEDLKAINASFSTLITSLMVSRLILNLRSAALRPQFTMSCVNSSQSVCLEDSAKGNSHNTLQGLTSIPKDRLSSDGLSLANYHSSRSTTLGRGTFASAVIGNLGEPVEWGSGDYGVGVQFEPQSRAPVYGHDRHKGDAEADIQEVPLELETDGIMLRERATDTRDKRKSSHHVCRKASHSRANHQHGRTRGGASVSTTSTSPVATGRLRGIVVAVTRDVHVEQDLGSAGSGMSGLSGRGGPLPVVDRLSEDVNNTGEDLGFSLSTSPPSKAPSLHSPGSNLTLELVTEDTKRAKTQEIRPSSSKGRVASRSGASATGNVPSAGGRDPAWMPPDTWNLEHGVQLEDLGKTS